MAMSFVQACPRPVKALAVATDASSTAARKTYWEPSQGAGAVAMIVGHAARTLAVDYGANGYCSFEVMDTLRPRPELEAGDSDLSLLSYMTCLQESYDHYSELVEGVDLRTTFRYIVLHTPFAGMVKSAHRRLMGKTSALFTDEIEADFARRVEPSVRFCKQVGNIYSGALYLAICSLLEYGEFERPERIGLFSYGSGCASEFYSGGVSLEGVRRVRDLSIPKDIADRWELSIPEYEIISDLSAQRMAGVRDLTPDLTPYQHAFDAKFAGTGLLVLEGISNFHRRYRWA
jgi:polyketide biosynthesis 3-hydroxy-3-methylglutaryl-CoA synthase-like enzyme PksG